MRTTVWIVGNQLLATSNLLSEVPRNSVILMIESRARGSLFRYHKKKLVLIYSAMRHYAQELRRRGWKVDYHPLADTPSFEEAFHSHIRTYTPGSIVTLHPADHPQLEWIGSIEKKTGVSFDLRPNDLFCTNPDEFCAYASGRSSLTMEPYYRRIRSRLGLLMTADGAPEGGAWNLDTENRKPFSPSVTPGKVRHPRPDDITQSAIQDVEHFFPDHPGSAKDFRFPVTRRQALAHLRRFINERLPDFGAYEDMMAVSEPHLHHSLLSPLLNIGLLHPLETVKAAEKAYREGRVPLNSAEGFIRQIIGWREFVYGVYWLWMPEYVRANALNARKDLPSLFYDADTEMSCLKHVVRQTIDEGYAHHIQRLMVLANFCTLAGIDPQQVYRWFMEMYIDAYDWVMVPNVFGMGLHADGGRMSTKPYVSSGSYISKMSDYCDVCAFDVKQKTGEQACPFNYLYWDFLMRNESVFKGNHRMRMMYSVLGRKQSSERERIRSDAKRFHRRIS